MGQMTNKQMCKLAFCAMYWYFGWGLPLFRIQYSLCGIATSAALCLILLILASGYGTVQKKVSIKDYTEYKGLGFCTILAHVFIIAINLFDLYNEERHLWHDYQGIYGEILLYVPICLYVLFCWSMLSTWSLKQSDATLVVDHASHNMYMAILFVTGTTNFLSLPLSVWYANKTIDGPSQQSFISVVVNAG